MRPGPVQVGRRWRVGMAVSGSVRGCLRSRSDRGHCCDRSRGWWDVVGAGDVRRRRWALGRRLGPGQGRARPPLAHPVTRAARPRPGCRGRPDRRGPDGARFRTRCWRPRTQAGPGPAGPTSARAWPQALRRRWGQGRGCRARPSWAVEGCGRAGRAGGSRVRSETGGALDRLGWVSVGGGGLVPSAAVKSLVASPARPGCEACRRHASQPVAGLRRSRRQRTAAAVDRRRDLAPRPSAIAAPRRLLRPPPPPPARAGVAGHRHRPGADRRSSWLGLDGHPARSLPHHGDPPRSNQALGSSASSRDPGIMLKSRFRVRRVGFTFHVKRRARPDVPRGTSPSPAGHAAAPAGLVQRPATGEAPSPQ